MNTWWAAQNDERFWLELTDRDDVGADLRAPLLDESGSENWRYTLFKRARIGDIVLHYQKRSDFTGIVGWSRIAGRSMEAEIVWAARGTYARSKGTIAHARPGYRIALDGFTKLSMPLSLSDIREQRSELETIVAKLEGTYGKPLYFPFELSPTRELRLLQGYAFKLPRSVVDLYPSLAPTQVAATATARGDAVSDDSSTTAPRNPPWSRDELILALELYLANSASPPSKGSREVAGLSAFLGLMGRALGQTDASTYRNPNGVYMKMMNFRRFDPAYTADGRVGLTRGNKDEEIVWREFSGDAVRLAAVAAAIRSAVGEHETDGQLVGDDEPEVHEAEEGRVLTRLHRVRERSRKLVELCKAAAIKKHGRLACAACALDFSKRYGPAGDGLIDVHHTKPVHTLAAGDKTALSDLVLLCANCHRVVHSSRRWFTVDQVRSMLEEQGRRTA